MGTGCAYDCPVSNIKRRREPFATRRLLPEYKIYYITQVEIDFK